MADVVNTAPNLLARKIGTSSAIELVADANGQVIVSHIMPPIPPPIAEAEEAPAE